MFSIFTKQKSFPVRTIEQLKNSVEILFIDNEEFNLTKELKEKDGWKRIKCVTDIKSLSQPELKDAHILCVDIQGVGKELGLVDEGLGLIAAIHDNYPEKKIIMYSAEAQGPVDARVRLSGLYIGSVQNGMHFILQKAMSMRDLKSRLTVTNLKQHLKDLLKKLSA